MIHLVSGREGYERYACMHSEEFINQVRDGLCLLTRLFF
jgi:hypothetical protein